MVYDPYTPRALPPEIPDPVLNTYDSARSIDFYRNNGDELFKTLNRHKLTKLRLREEIRGVLPYSEGLEEARLLESYIANFYIFEYFGYSNGFIPSEQDIDILTDNMSLVRGLLYSDIELSDKQISLLAAVGQKLTVDFLEDIVFNYVVMACLGELRYHPFAHQAFFGGSLDWFYQYGQPDSNECDFFYRRKDPDNECYCEYCQYRLYGADSDAAPRGPSTNRRAAWHLGLDWACKCPAELFDLMAELFHEFDEDSGYGGSAWATAAEVLALKKRGELGPTDFQNKKIFLDRAFSLEHNGGCLFDKLYEISYLGIILHQHHYSSIENLLSHGYGDIVTRLDSHYQRTKA
jgi:hypothetical protein